MDDPLATVAALPGVTDAAGRARDAVDRLLGHRVLRRNSAAVTAESALRGSRASAVLEGSDVTLEEVRRLVRAVPGELDGVPRSAPGDGERLQSAGPAVIGAVRVSAGLGALLPVWERAPLQALARLHLLAAADVLTPEDLGRPRTGPWGRPGGGRAAPDASESDGALGPAPNPAEVGARLEELVRLLVAPTAAPAVVVAAVVHGELLALRPFAWGNGLVARAAQRLVLVGRGVDPKAVSVPEVGHLDLGRASYSGALAGYAGGSADGVAGWLTACGEAVRLGAREGLAVCEAVSRGG